MKFASAKKFDRKSGGSPFNLFYSIDPGNPVTQSKKHSKNVFIVPRTLWRTWGTRRVHCQIDGEVGLNGRSQKISVSSCGGTTSSWA
jgi:hypothetical protein